MAKRNSKPEMVPTIAVTVVPDTDPTPAAGEGDTEVVKRKVAEHALIGADGKVCENEEDAMGISYTLLAVPNEPFTYSFGKNPDADRMLAIFGAKTLATNETSQARNNAKGAASPSEQIAAVRERFDLLCSSPAKWVDRTREGVGAKVDKDALAEAVCQVLVAQGKVTDEQVAQGYKAKVRAKLEDAPDYQRTARAVPGVNEAYAKLVGRATKTADDLLAALG